MPHYSILIFDEGVSSQKIFTKFSEQELAHLVFTSNGRSSIAGAVDYLSKINDERGLQAFLISSVLKQTGQVEREQARYVEALRETTVALNQSLNLREVLDCILNKVGLVVPYDATNIMLIEQGIARMAACCGYEKLGGAERVMKQVRIVRDVPNLLRMSETGQPIIVPDTRESPDWIEFNTSTWIRSYVSVPIIRQNRTIGFLNLNSATPGLYDEQAAERLLLFASQAAVAIENARLYENAQRELTERKRAEEALQETMNELEARVQQRTSELSSANEKLMFELARRKQAEEALEQERALLATRVEERTAELSAANAELAKAVRLKDAFLANMSHELRTPLNAILNISETLLEQAYGELNDAEMRSVKTIEDSGRHLLTLINDILDLSKIGAGKFEINLDSVVVHDACQASLSLIETAARKKQITVETTYDPAVKTVWADQRRLRQVLLNLLSNAVKFTPAGGSIGLTVTGDAVHNTVQFTVWDTGIGIPEESLGSLFKPFVQLDNSLARQYEGTGLGLALVYHIIELHGGGIRVESESGKGSKFIVSLNWEGEADVDASMNVPPEPGSLTTEMREADDITQVCRLLKEMGIASKKVWVEKGARPALGNLNPDFLIMDQRLAQLGLAGMLRKCAETREVPMLILAGSGIEPATPQNITNSAFVPSPYNRQDLRATIKRFSSYGTGSLVHNAVIFSENPSLPMKDRQTILLVDDNEVGLGAVSDYLMVKGYKIVRAYNGAEAVERARESAPDLILMDIQMPGMDGYEAIRCIRRDPNFRRVPIFAFTALAMPRDRERCLEAGATEYLSKPISLKLLADMIDKQFQRHPSLSAGR